jgi:GTP cyclohydrolase I
VQSLITTKSPLCNNQIELHKPKLKNQETNEILQKLGEQRPETNLENSKHHLASLYERLKSNYRTSETMMGDLSKRYRQDDTNTIGFDNVNFVVPGRFNPKPRPDGVTQCKKDSSTNGTVFAVTMW